MNKLKTILNYLIDVCVVFFFFLMFFIGWFFVTKILFTQEVSVNMGLHDLMVLLVLSTWVTLSQEKED